MDIKKVIEGLRPDAGVVDSARVYTALALRATANPVRFFTMGRLVILWDSGERG